MGPLLALIVTAVMAGLGQWYLGQWRMRRMLERQARPLVDAPLEAAIGRLGDVAGIDGLRARQLDMPIVNGLATPDGQVLLTSGMLEHYRRGALEVDEIASVVAHEIGHVALGHHARRLVDYSGQNAARMVLMVLLNRVLPGIGAYLATWLGGLLMAGLSRRDEFEADRYATALMLKAGFGHAPQVRMFRKLERIVPGAQGPAWMQSHPDVAQRIAAIEANAAVWEATAHAAR